MSSLPFAHPSSLIPHPFLRERDGQINVGEEVLKDFERRGLIRLFVTDSLTEFNSPTAQLLRVQIDKGRMGKYNTIHVVRFWENPKPAIQSHKSEELSPR
jgi:hypothetical protein